jgi:signal transduction histidine kinase
LLVLVLLATLLPASMMGWRFLRDSDKEVQAATQAMVAAADDLAGDLGQRVQGTAQLQFGLAQAHPLDSPDRAICSAFLSHVREAYPQYTGLLTVRPDGTLFCDSLQTGRALNLTDRPYFRRALRGDQAVVVEPAFGRLTGLPVLQIVHAARSDQGALRFLIVASLNLQKFAQGRAALPHSAAAQLLLVDENGLVLVGGKGLVAGSSIAGTALFALAQALRQGGVGELPDAQGQTQVWAVAGQPAARQASLHVLLGLPRHELVADTQQRLRQDLLALAALSLMLFAAVWLLAEWGIRRQVSRITSMVRRLGEGDLSARIALPYPRGELGGLMAVLNSTATSLEQQRQAIEELGQQLRQAQKLEAIGTLAGGIAHDFNNVLGAILGNLSLAHEEALAGQPNTHSLAQIRRAALRARDLVQRIQSFSRSDAPRLAPLALQPLVEEVLALVAVGLPPGAALHTRLQAEPMKVMGDATQLHQVLLNLCTNAWQALQGKPGSLTVGLQAEEGRAHLWVADTGCGITPADRERLFEPFFTTRAHSGGSGLGLSVVHGIVHAHHGDIAVDSAPGQGSTFHLRLPLLDGPALPADAAHSGNGLAGATQGQGQRVLYVDDDDVMALLVERLLVRAGYRVSCHLSANAALAALRADPAACDLVVTDFNMPEQSGLELGRALAALRPGLPVVLISGYIFDELPAQARRAGMREVVRKQHVMEDLLPAVARALAGGG